MMIVTVLNTRSWEMPNSASLLLSLVCSFSGVKSVGDESKEASIFPYTNVDVQNQESQ